MKKLPYVCQMIVGSLLLGLTGAGCPSSVSERRDTPADQASPVAKAVLPSEAEIDTMSDEERAKAMEEYMKTNEAAPVDPVKKEQATELADEMKKMATEKSGAFHKVVHEASGSARLVKSGDGWAVVLSDDFKTDAGPDLHVYVSGSSDPRKSPDVHQDLSLDLGRLTNVEGKQAYEIGAVDIENIKSVVIYCKPFKVVFAAATLQ